MAKRINDLIYYHRFDGERLTEEEQAEFEAAGEPKIGYYRFNTLEDIVNNFMVAYTGEGKIFERVKRFDVEWHAQRGVQEFNFDILRSEVSVEVELSDRLNIPLPSDYVNYTQISFIDVNGRQHPLLNKDNRETRFSLPYLQDENYEYLYDSTGEVIVADNSEAKQRWQSSERVTTGDDRDGYVNSLYTDDYYDYFYSGYYGRRYGSTPEDQNVNGGFVIDTFNGTIAFDSSFRAGDIISVQYVSDGISNSDDFSKVCVHKFAEEALYSYILWGLSRGMKGIQEYQVQRFAKDKSSQMRNAKLRLSKLQPIDIAQTLRNRAKWIKH